MKKHVGAEIYKNRYLAYVIEIKAKNDSLALIEGLNNFRLEEINQPIFPNIKGAILPLIKIDTCKILIRERKTKK